MQQTWRLWVLRVWVITLLERLKRILWWPIVLLYGLLQLLFPEISLLHTMKILRPNLGRFERSGSVVVAALVFLFDQENVESIAASKQTGQSDPETNGAKSVFEHASCNDKIPSAEMQKPKGGGALTGGVKRGPQGRFEPRDVKKQKITQGVQLIPSKKQPPSYKMTELEIKSPRASNVKENVESIAGSKQTGLSDPETTSVKRAVSVLDEEGAHPKTGASDADTHQQGESAQPDRQVSPNKLARVALLKNRYADTILKAREKTLNQVIRGDPDELQREREQFERWKREEKARLQAEAKQAEGVRKKAEVEAAAEAKHKIELEREAARQALKNLEKSVEIDLDDQIFKELERMGCAAPNYIPSYVNALDGLGNFPLQRKNPLEQLGLFMKVHEEEE